MESYCLISAAYADVSPFPSIGSAAEPAIVEVLEPLWLLAIPP